MSTPRGNPDRVPGEDLAVLAEETRTSLQEALWEQALAVLSDRPPREAWRILGESLPGKLGKQAKTLVRKADAFLDKRKARKYQRPRKLVCRCGQKNPHDTLSARRRCGEYHWYRYCGLKRWKTMTSEARRDALRPATLAAAKARASRLVAREVSPRLQEILGPDEALKMARRKRKHVRVNPA